MLDILLLLVNKFRIKLMSWIKKDLFNLMGIYINNTIVILFIFNYKIYCIKAMMNKFYTYSILVEIIVFI